MPNYTGKSLESKLTNLDAGLIVYKGLFQFILKATFLFTRARIDLQ